MSKRHRRRAVSAAAPPLRRDANGVWWRAAILLAACVATYWNSLDGAFISDDLISIVRSPQIREWWSLTSILFPLEDTSFAGRPLAHFSFAINYALGGLDVRGYHVGNILVHTSCALLVFAVVRRTLQLPAIDAAVRSSATNLAFATALVWAVHPLNSDPVNYLTQRTESLMALFYLLTIYASVRALHSRTAGRWQAAAIVSCALGMLCKESMVTAPVVVVLYDRVYGFESVRDALRSRWRLYAGLAATWLLLGALLMTGARGTTSGFSSDVTPWTYLLNQSVIIAHYLQLAAWPRSLVIDYGWALPLTLRDVWPYAAAIAALLLATVVALVRKPQLGFAAAWFFIALSPTSSILPIPNEVGRECRMYVPMVGLVALAIVGASAVWATAGRAWIPAIAGRGASVGSVVLALLATSLATATVFRNRDYRSPLTVYRTMVERWPTARTHHIYGSELVGAGRGDEAIAHLQAAADAVPWARHQLGFELYRQGRYEEGIQHLEKVIEIWQSPPASHPHWQKPLRIHAVSARTVIGQARAQQQRWTEAIEQYRLALAIDPTYPDALKLLPEALLRHGAYDEAAARYRELVKVRPKDAVVTANLGVALVATGEIDEAISTFRRAAELDPRESERHLANALFDKGDMVQALVHARRAVEVSPDDPGARDVLGRALAVHGKYDEAIGEFEQALRIDPGHEDARTHLERVRAVRR